VLLDYTEAAKRAGYDRTRISQLVGAGRLTAIPKPGHKRSKLIDSDELDKFIANPTVRQRSTRTGVKQATTASASSLPPLEPGGSAPPPPPAQAEPASRARIGRISAADDDFSQFLNEDGSYNMERCRAWGEFEKARKLQVERMAAEGKYVAVADVSPVWSRVFVSINRNIMGIANRVKSDNPDLDIGIVNQIEYLCREALKAVSEEVKTLDPS
jgi:hypothetical protein